MNPNRCGIMKRKKNPRHHKDFDANGRTDCEDYVKIFV
jgi:hypothetical protein